MEYNIPKFDTQISIIVFILKIFFTSMCTYYTYLKILGLKYIINIRLLIIILVTIIVSIVSSIIKYTFNYYLSIVFLILSLGISYSTILKKDIGYSIIITTISLSINYIVFFISTIINYLPNVIVNFENDLISLFFIMIIDIIILHYLYRIKKFKYGITFLKRKNDNEFFDIFILNISIAILFLAIIFNKFNLILLTNLFFIFIVFIVVMFVTIQKLLSMYYKHKLLEKELNETKDELNQKNKELQKLEQENLNFSKTSHSIVHRQKALENKLNELMMKNEIGEELDIADKIKEISKEYSKIIPKTELSKSGITQIDDMLKYMQTECVKNKINFELKLNGDIHYMVNHYVTKQELEILLADHIKDAIIAIQHSNNINKSILVKLGIINGEYSLYVYDSGIEFEIDTLLNLGDKPITTHENEGGTGMGFLNTFDTLNRHNASLIINEIGSPVKDNYTKAIIIKFNNKHEFKIKSYRIKDFENKNHDNCKFDFEE